MARPSKRCKAEGYDPLVRTIRRVSAYLFVSVLYPGGNRQGIGSDLKGKRIQMGKYLASCI